MRVPTLHKNILRKIFVPRKKHSHKGDHGRLLIIGGSKRYTGSPGLVALAAIRTGVDLTTVASPTRAADITASMYPDMITEPLRGDYLGRKHLKKILELAGHATAVVIGNGMGRNKKIFDFVLDFIREVKTPCVIDADAIYALSHFKRLIRHDFIITPHPHEFYILTGHKPSFDLSKNIPLVAKEAENLKCTLILKGHTDIISNGKQTVLNKTGNPYMSKGGTGDSLAGICGALLAMGTSPFNSACAGAFINGKAGELATLKHGTGFLVKEMINLIPSVLK